MNKISLALLVLAAGCHSGEPAAQPEAAPAATTATQGAEVTATVMEPTAAAVEPSAPAPVVEAAPAQAAPVADKASKCASLRKKAETAGHVTLIATVKSDGTADVTHPSSAACKSALSAFPKKMRQGSNANCETGMITASLDAREVDRVCASDAISDVDEDALLNAQH